MKAAGSTLQEKKQSYSENMESNRVVITSNASFQDKRYDKHLF